MQAVHRIHNFNAGPGRLAAPGAGGNPGLLPGLPGDRHVHRGDQPPLQGVRRDPERSRRPHRAMLGLASVTTSSSCRAGPPCSSPWSR